ncbi:hypothetical protein CEQ07_05100 [Oligella urethralis]|nr:hypothetical protein CEQ07_05100 [Oligella urethralis]
MDIYPKIKIPKGMRIWSVDNRIVGTSYRFSSVLKFIKYSEHQLSFEPDPNNLKDKNAIKIMGHYKNNLLHLGFVDKQTAKALADLNLTNLVLPRVDRIWLSDDQKRASLEYSILIHRKYFDNANNGISYNVDERDLASEKSVADNNKSPLPPTDKPRVYPHEQSHIIRNTNKSGLTKSKILFLVVFVIFLIYIYI